jgi:hypothetical protein
VLFLKFAVDFGIRNVNERSEVLEFKVIRQPVASDNENAGHEPTYA